MTSGLGGLARRLAALPARQKALLAVLVTSGAGLLWLASTQHHNAATLVPATDISSQAKRSRIYRPTPAEWASLVVATAEPRPFRPELVTDGRIAINEDRATPIFSPYAGRVIKLLAKPGDAVTRGQPLFVVEAAEAVQSLNDFMSAATTANKARANLELARIVEKRNHDLYDGKAVALKEWQQAQAELTTAQNDLRSAETALEAARNRLRIMGRADEEISAFQETGKINPDTPIPAPISGTIVQRKVGPGQYVTPGSSDPVFIIGDLSEVWVTAYVRETDASKVGIGQDIEFAVVAYPNKTYAAKIDYVAAALEPTSRRLMVRAPVDNSDLRLKPDMFATITVFGSGDAPAPAVPREALISDGRLDRIWVVQNDNSIELRTVRTGVASGGIVQVTDGLAVGERFIANAGFLTDLARAGS